MLCRLVILKTFDRSGNVKEREKEIKQESGKYYRLARSCLTRIRRSMDLRSPESGQEEYAYRPKIRTNYCGR